MAAAVSDFTVVQSKTKLKSGDSIELKLTPTEDLIKNFRRSKPSTKILAFSVADRDSDWVEIAKLKKLEKEVDFIFANTTDAFSSDESHGVLIAEEAHELSGSKSEIAQGAVQLIQGSLLK
jgi:phosphopantothenoylcysteine synthetase/decarboxylase